MSSQTPTNPMNVPEIDSAFPTDLEASFAEAVRAAPCRAAGACGAAGA